MTSSVTGLCILMVYPLSAAIHSPSTYASLRSNEVALSCIFVPLICSNDILNQSLSRHMKKIIDNERISSNSELIDQLHLL
ncbi:hypothetical protein C8K58_12219 [Pseudomonas sp. GV047]|nr:hypothetical protein C8K58_12219 [Pseudomonas sp. GV047]